jgi:hypothetical protein
MAFYKWLREIGLPGARPLGAALWAALFLFLAASQAGAQGKLDRIEWFAEAGESFLSLGNQPGTYRVAGTYGYPPYEAAIVSPSRFSSAASGPPVLVGLRYRLTSQESVEVSYSNSVNRFGLEPVGGGARSSSTFERTPALEINYVRYFGSIGGWRPFGVGGAGVAWQSTLVTGLDCPEPSFDFGFGADHQIIDGLAFRVEVRDYVERLPSPLRGYSNDIAPTAGLVISSRPPGTGQGGLSRIEVYLEGGGSFLTGASAPSRAEFCTQGGTCSVLPSVVRGSFSKTGRYAGGFRIYLSRRNALQFEHSTGPNRSQAQESATVPPYPAYSPMQDTQSVLEDSVDYVRYLGTVGATEPFIQAGGGWAHYAGFYTGDVSEFGWNFGGGVDIPLAKQLALRIEMRDFLSRQPFPPLQPLYGWTNNLAPMVGLALRFR